MGIRASKVTTLKVGQVEVAVGLYSNAGKPGKLAEFETAGPNGGKLYAQSVAVASPVEPEPVPSDPLADALGAELDAVRDGTSEDRGREVHDEIRERGKLSYSDAVQSGIVVEPDEKSVEQLAAEEDARRMAEQEAERLGAPRGFEIPSVEERKSIAADRMKIDSLSAALNEGLATGGPVTVSTPVVAGEYKRELFEEGSGVMVPADEVRKGVRLDDGTFVDCTEQLKRIDEDTKLEAMEVVSFVDVTQIPRAWITGAYYIGAADKKAGKPLKLFFEAMRSTRRAAVVKVTKRSRQTLAVLAANNGVLMLFDLMWHEDVRTAPTQALAMHNAKVTDAEVEMAKALVNVMAGTVDTLTELRDDGLAGREALYEEAILTGSVSPIEVKPATSQDILIGQLEASLAAVAS